MNNGILIPMVSVSADSSCPEDPDLNTYLQPERSNRDNNDLTSDMTWLTTEEDSSKWDAMESGFIGSRLK